MRIFLSYKFTGENEDELRPIIKNICSSLEKAGHATFCSFWKTAHFKEKNFNHEQILKYAFNELDNCDCLLAFINSPIRSEGMCIEVGYALAKGKKVIAAIKDGVRSPFIESMANYLIEFDGLEDLYEKLNKLK